MSGLFVCQPNAKLSLATFTIKTNVPLSDTHRKNKKTKIMYGVHLIGLIFLYFCLSSVEKFIF